MLNELDKKLINNKKTSYKEFLELSYEYLLEKAKKIENPEYLNNSLLNKDVLEVLIINTMTTVKKELGIDDEDVNKEIFNSSEEAREL